MREAVAVLVTVVLALGPLWVALIAAWAMFATWAMFENVRRVPEARRHVGPPAIARRGDGRLDEVRELANERRGVRQEDGRGHQPLAPAGAQWAFPGRDLHGDGYHPPWVRWLTPGG